MMNGQDESTEVRGIRRPIYIALAIICFAVGILGVVLPILPTTPFFLLMSYFLVRASPWLHRHVVRLPFVGGPIRDWRENRGVRRRVKWLAYAMVFAAVAVTVCFSTNWPVKAATASLASIGILVVWRLPTIE